MIAQIETGIRPNAGSTVTCGKQCPDFTRRWPIRHDPVIHAVTRPISRRITLILPWKLECCHDIAAASVRASPYPPVQPLPTPSPSPVEGGLIPAFAHEVPGAKIQQSAVRHEVKSLLVCRHIQDHLQGDGRWSACGPGSGAFARFPGCIATACILRIFPVPGNGYAPPCRWR